METKNLLKEYLSRLIRQTLVQVTGVFGFILTAIIEILLPGVLIKWVFYLIILVAGLIVGSYFVFADLAKEFKTNEDEHKRIVSNLEQRISQIEDAQPLIYVGIQDENHHSVKKLDIQLGPLPPKPNFEALVEEKRKELLAKRSSSRSLNGMAAAIAAAAMGRVSPNYKQEVEEYLVEYHDFLVRAYESTVDRVYPITPIVMNKGQSPANNVTIEFVMPAGYKKPEKHQRFSGLLNEEGFDPYLFPPDEPQPFISHFDVLSSVRLPDLSGTILPHLEQLANINGPFHEEKDGVHYITYTIEKLIQHRVEDDFDPFWLWLADIQEPTVWEIPVRIYAADLRKPQKETIILDLRISEINGDTS